MKSVSEGTVVITDQHKKDVTLVVQALSTLRKRGEEGKPVDITTKDLKAGDHVIVRYVESDGKKLVKALQVRQRQGTEKGTTKEKTQ